MGKWYQVAVVSTCTHYMQRKSRSPDMVAMVLQHVDSELNFTKTATSSRSDVWSSQTQSGDLSRTWAEFDPSVGTARASRWPHTTAWPPRRAAFSTTFQVFSCFFSVSFSSKVFICSKPFFLTGFGADVDSFVVATDYEDFAVMLQLSTEKLSGNRSTNLILYSGWSKEIRP